MDFRKKIILAPMVGATDISFRKLCTKYGADIVYSQMIDSNAFSRGSTSLADFHDEKNVVAQFFGNDAEMMKQCALQVQEKVQAVDINLGCPHSNVVERKCGSYLMRYPKRIEKIVTTLVKALDIPVTVKIRAGYDKQHINAVRVAKLCERAGVSAITIHGRARTVNYMHPVDYGIIKKVKESVSVPVIGNGDIFSALDAKKMSNTGVDSIMIGRAAVSDPTVFNSIKCHSSGKKFRYVSKKRLFHQYVSYAKKYNPPFELIKTHAQWLTKGQKHGAYFREQMNRAKTIDDLESIYLEIDKFK